MAVNVTLELPVLKRGSDEHGAVRRLQHMLNILLSGAEEGSAPLEPLDEDGVFGPKTEARVKIYQGADVGALTVDGIVGKQTWTKLLTDWAKGSQGG